MNAHRSEFTSFFSSLHICYTHTSEETKLNICDPVIIVLKYHHLLSVMMLNRLQRRYVFIFNYISHGTELLTNIWNRVLLLCTIKIPLYTV